jgi:toxin ParE1/3/4
VKRLRWTEAAVHDLTRICDYIEERGGSGSARQVAVSIYQGVSGLVAFPERGRIGRKPGTRELVLHPLPYLAIYRIREDVVEVLRILHGAQNWP